MIQSPFLDGLPSQDMVIHMQGRHGQSCQQRPAVSVRKTDITLFQQEPLNSEDIMLVVKVLGSLDGL